MAVEGDLAINGLASSPAVDGETEIDPSLNPPINWAFTWGDVADPGAVTVPGGVGVGTDTEINVVDVGGAGAGGGGIDGALVYSMDAIEDNHLVFDASTYELAVTLTVHSDHANVHDDAGAPTDQSGFRVILKDNDGVDYSLPARAVEDINYEFDITNVAKEQSIELAMPLDSPTSFYHDPSNGMGDSIANFDADDPFGAEAGGAFEMQVAPAWGSHGRFHITLHEIAIRLITETGLPGDFNDDDIVDAADYTVWRDNFGDLDETAIAFNGDGGDIGAGDYDVWAQNFGSAANSSSQAVAKAVPEPQCWALLIAGMLSASMLRRDVQ